MEQGAPAGSLWGWDLLRSPGKTFISYDLALSCLRNTKTVSRISVWEAFSPVIFWITL